MVCVRAKTRTGMRNTIQVYTPKLYYRDEQYQYYLDSMRLKINAVQKDEDLQGNFNSMADDQHSSGPEVVGKFGLCRTNDRGQQIQQFCA